MQGTASNTFSTETLKLSRELEPGTWNFPAPKYLAYRPFQSVGIRFALRLIDAGRNVLIADPPGIGKTIQSIGVINTLSAMTPQEPGILAKSLIIVPFSVQSNWKKELDKWLIDFPKTPLNQGRTKMRVGFLDGKTLKGPCDFEIGILSVGMCSQKDIVQRVTERFKYDLCVIDEAHAFKNPKAQRTKNVLGKGGLVKHAGLATIAMTGTPIVNRPIELFPTIASLAPGALNRLSYLEYGIKYCNGHKTTKAVWGGRRHEVWDFTGASNLKELGVKLRSYFMIRRSKKALLPFLPEKQISLIYLNRNRDIDKLIARTSGFTTNDLQKKKHFNDFALEDEESLSEYRKNYGVEKAPIAAEYIKNELDGGRDKVVLFAHHQEVLDILKSQLSEYGVVEIRGSTSRDRRGQAVDKFQEDKNTRVFLGSITAANVGLTLTASSYVAFIEPDWVPGVNEQAADRVHRIGQEADKVEIEYLVFENDLDEIMIKSNLNKQDNIDEVLQ